MSTVILKQNNLRFELFEPNTDYDDNWKLICFDKSNMQCGHITFKMQSNPDDYDIIFDGEVANIVDEYEPICLEYLVVEPKYRLKGIGKLLLQTFINYIVQDNTCILLKALFGVSKELQEKLDTDVLPKFYESFGFKQIEPNHNYYVLNLY